MARGRKVDSRKAILYCRVSTQEQVREGVSLAAQEESLRAYCKLRGLEVVGVVVDAGVSGGKPLASREGGAQVLAVIKSGAAGAVVAWKLDRLFRDTIDCLAATRRWDHQGVALHLVDLGGQSVDTTSSTGRFFLTMLAALAEMERNRISERTACAMQYKRSRHEFCGGDAPYGWRVTGDKVEADPQEQEIIGQARELRNAGLSLRKIGRQLLERGQRPRGGRTWNPASVRSLLRAEAA